MKWYFLPLLLILGCAQKSHFAFDGVSASHPTASRQIAQEAASHLSRAYPPAQTMLSVSGSSPFGEAFEAALREHGFSIGAAGVEVGYQLDMLQEESLPVCYLTLQLPDGVLNQSYSLSGGLVVANSNFTKAGFPEYSAYADYSADSYAGGGLAPEVSPPAQNTGVVALADTPKMSVSAIESKPVAVPKVIVPESVLPKQEPIPLASAPLVGVSERREPAYVAVPPLTPEPKKIVNPKVIVPEPVKIEPLVVPSSTSPAVTAALIETVAITPIEVLPVVPAVVEPIRLVEPSWEIKPGMLRSQLERWAVTAGYEVVWKSQHDYDIQASAVFRDDFVGAIKRLFTHMHLQGNPLRVTVYKDNNVIEVTED